MYRNVFYDANEATQTRRGGTPRRGRRPHSYDYEAFGNVYGTPTENLTQPFRFTGRAWDSETELYYYRARNYAAGTGQFASRDMFAGFASYIYAHNSPVGFVDPLGNIARAVYRGVRFAVDVLMNVRRMEPCWWRCTLTFGSVTADVDAEIVFDWPEIRRRRREGRPPFGTCAVDGVEYALEQSDVEFHEKTHIDYMADNAVRATFTVGDTRHTIEGDARKMFNQRTTEQDFRRGTDRKAREAATRWCQEKEREIERLIAKHLNQRSRYRKALRAAINKQEAEEDRQYPNGTWERAARAAVCNRLRELLRRDPNARRRVQQGGHGE